MNLCRSLNVITCIFLLFDGFGQRIEVLHEGSGISLRGLSVVSDEVIWVSGNKGTTGKSMDGGRTWQWNKVFGYELKDFRILKPLIALLLLLWQ